jgi:hypothetical protein
MRRGLTAFHVRGGKPVLISRKIKKIEAPENRKNISVKGGKHCRAIFVATKDSPQKRTAIIRAMYVRRVCLSDIVFNKTWLDQSGLMVLCDTLRQTNLTYHLEKISQ